MCPYRSFCCWPSVPITNWLGGLGHGNHDFCSAADFYAFEEADIAVFRLDVAVAVDALAHEVVAGREEDKDDDRPAEALNFLSVSHFACFRLEVEINPFCCNWTQGGGPRLQGF